MPAAGRQASHRHRSVGAVATQYYACGFKQNGNISPQRPVFYIPGIKIDAGVIIDIITAAYLPQTGHTRLGHQVVVNVTGIAFQFSFDNRTRSYQAHLSADHVPELRKLIKAGFAQEAADAGNTRIVFQLEVTIPFCPRLLAGCQQRLQDVL